MSKGKLFQGRGVKGRMASDTKEEVGSRNQVGKDHVILSDIYDCLFKGPKEILQAQASILQVKLDAGSMVAGGRDSIADYPSCLHPMGLPVYISFAETC